jgi:peptide/nickel transport system substrate-binding protein
MIFISKNKKLITISIAIIFMFLSGCVDDSQNNDDEIKIELSVAMLRNSTGYYPWMLVRDTTTLTVNINIFNSLIKIDQHNLGFKPALAEDWYNPDNVTWRFFLRKDVKFHNGYNFTAEDVKFTLEFLNNFSYSAELLQQISEIDIIDNYTIDLRTEKPYPNLLNKLLTIYMISKNHILESEKLDETWPIGTGAYKLVEDNPGKYIILERFDDYWRELPDIERVVFRKVNNSIESINGLKNGDFDIISLSYDDVEEIESFDGLKVASVQPPNVVYISFDFREFDSYGFSGEKNPVSDFRVRKAIYHSINISYLIDKFFNDSAVPVSQFVTEDLFGYNPDIKRLPFNLSLARQYMNDAGFEKGFNITFDAPLSPLAVNLSNEIAKQLSEINITLIPNFLPSTDYYLNLYYKNTSMYITSINHFDSESSLNLLLETSNMDESDGIWNYGNYSNEQVDIFIDMLSYTMDINERKDIIQEAFSVASDDVAWVPLYSTKAFFGVSDNLNWNPRPSLFIWVEEIYLD